MSCYVILHILLFSTCPSVDTLSTALYKESFDRILQLGFVILSYQYNTTTDYHMCAWTGGFLAFSWIFLSVVAFLMASGNASDILMILLL